MLKEEKELIQKLIREIIVLREDIASIEKTLVRINKETIELYEKMDKLLNGG